MILMILIPTSKQITDILISINVTVTSVKWFITAEIWWIIQLGYTYGKCRNESGLHMYGRNIWRRFGKLKHLKKINIFWFKKLGESFCDL